MVKSSASSSSSSSAAAALQRVSDQSSSSCKYKGVRKRTWGKYVSEIRLPNSRERIWLGSYDTAEKAARAFDAAQFCLRGRSGRFNFPDDPPVIVDAGSMTRAEIQAAAARYARLGSGPRASTTPGLDTESDSLTSHMGSPAASLSDGAFAKVDFEMTEIPLDDSFLDQIFTLGSESNSISDFGLFPGFDDFIVVPRVDCWSEGNEDMLLSDASSSLWNF